MKRMETIAIMAGVLMTSQGCRTLPTEALQKDIAARQQQIEELTRTVNEQQKQIDQLSRERDSLRVFSKDRIEELVHIEKIKLGRYTRLTDRNKDGKRDSAVVYLELADREGDEIKAAGSAAIELWALGAAEGECKLGRWEYGIKETGQHWYGGLLADHFKFEIIPAGQVDLDGRNLTLKVCFTELLTGRTFEVQKLLEK